MTLPAFSRFLHRVNAEAYTANSRQLDVAESQMASEFHGVAGSLRHFTLEDFIALDADLEDYGLVCLADFEGFSVHPVMAERAKTIHDAALQRASEQHPELTSTERLAVASIREQMKENSNA